MSKNPPTPATMTQIMSGAQIKGDVLVESDLRVEGYIKGMVKVGGTLIIVESGKVEGDVHARVAEITGQLVGNLLADEKVILNGRSLLMGDLKTRELVIHEGARFQGNCQMEVREA